MFWKCTCKSFIEGNNWTGGDSRDSCSQTGCLRNFVNNIIEFCRAGWNREPKSACIKDEQSCVLQWGSGLSYSWIWPTFVDFGKLLLIFDNFDHFGPFVELSDPIPLIFGYVGDIGHFFQKYFFEGFLGSRDRHPGQLIPVTWPDFGSILLDFGDFFGLPKNERPQGVPRIGKSKFRSMNP